MTTNTNTNINSVTSNLTQKYGPFMTVGEYAEVMKIKCDTVYKQIANGTVEVGPIVNEARRKHLFPTQLVAEWVETAIQTCRYN